MIPAKLNNALIVLSPKTFFVKLNIELSPLLILNSFAKSRLFTLPLLLRK